MPTPRRAFLAPPVIAILALVAIWASGRPEPRVEGWLARDRMGQLPDGVLRVASARAMARLRFTECLVEELVAGRLVLGEAAGRLEAYLAAEPAARRGCSVGGLGRVFPGRTARERCARGLARWVRARAGVRPSEAAEQSARRVERELEFGHPDRPQYPPRLLTPR